MHFPKSDVVSRAKSRDAIDHAKFSSSSRDAAIRVYDEAGNVIETHEHAGDFKGSANCS
jgi:hypothetical protein